MALAKSGEPCCSSRDPAKTAKRRLERAASPTTSVLLINVDADANHPTIIAIVMIAATISVLTVVEIPPSVVAVARVPHDDLLEEVADERVPVRHRRPVLDEGQRAGERCAVAAAGSRWSRRSLRADRAGRPLRT